MPPENTRISRGSSTIEICCAPIETMLQTSIVFGAILPRASVRPDDRMRCSGVEVTTSAFLTTTPESTPPASAQWTS